MTKWQETPLRPHDQAWPGLNTRGGELDLGRGEMLDCTNVIINRADILAKRSGLIRALDEQFTGPVCGLFAYTDYCGVERLLVADEEAISIRTPFVVPVFTAADCYPGDSFSLPDGSPLDDTLWRNTARYTHLSDSMVLTSITADADTEDAVVAGTTRWFKDACSASYQVRVRYDFDAANIKQKVAVVLRGQPGLQTAMILGVLEFVPNALYRVRIFHRDASGNYTELLTSDVTGQNDGFFTVGYSQATRTANFQITVTGGTITPTIRSNTALTEIQDADLGLTSAIGLSFTSGAVPSGLGIRVVTGGSI